MWSPDGRAIAIEDSRTPGTQTLWIASSDGRRTRRVVDYASETYGGVDWMPGGKGLVFAGLANGRMQIFSVPALGGPATQLTHDSFNLMHPRVSRDGHWIACSRLQTRQELRSLTLN